MSSPASFVTEKPKIVSKRKSTGIYGLKWFLFGLLITTVAIMVSLFPNIALYASIPGGLLSVLLVCWLIVSPLKRFIVFIFCKSVDPTNKSILITGCDQGLGHGMALSLNSLGFKVFASCYDPTSSGAALLKQNASNKERMIIFKLDVTNDHYIDYAVEFITSHLEATPGDVLWAVINNAGLSRTGKLEWGTFDHHFRSLFEVNTFGVVKVTRAFLPLLRKSFGRVIIISSFGGRVTSSFMTAYAMSKAAIICFADGLRLEMMPFGVSVVSVEPVFARTPMMDPQISNQRIDEMWTNTVPSVQQVYGKEQVDQVKQAIELLHTSPMGLDETYQDVIRCVTRSVISPVPEYVEQPASFLQKPLNMIVQSIPREWVDVYLLIVDKILSLIGSIKGKPNNS
ncbi:D-beta-hydroxybutyrate dehydrogenase, mitochondrial-like [Tetranychus urticae]|uniref:Uncharacterized protein n=1 Tax=Tetranychus urticae TaxID=32264 RepID=T1KQQ4_TETUR|nr:D-beta-hydroxybutyrate dehydrogenase, mitochondrial-like [Tetranychus urticae]